MEKVKQLDDDQLEGFDWEFIDSEKRQAIFTQINRDFPSGEFSFIDIGGGNGSFTDRVLNAFPKSKGLVIDNSEMLLSKNEPRAGKSVLCESVENLENVLTEKYDIVFFNLILHHLVGDSYSASRQFQRKELEQAIRVLDDRGRISVFENVYDGSVIDSVPSHMIFNLTVSKPLKKLVSKLGANTAGVGVCFLSKRQWEAELSGVGLQVTNYSNHREFEINKLKKTVLHLGYVRGGHFWCETTAQVPGN